MEAHKQDQNFIQSIDVVTKTPKPYGRGLKAIYRSPLRAYAEQEDLPVHPISTFTGWKPTWWRNLSGFELGKDINLIIAVSFGLFVPPRIVNAARYGGLNIHPSLLPALRGPAPLQHTLIQNLRETGVSLCTLDSKRFDHGQVLRQQKFNVSGATMENYYSLQQYLAHRGGDLLLNGLRDGCFIPPLDTVKSLPEASHAPKLTNEDYFIEWTKWPTDRILQTQKLGRPLRSYWISISGQNRKISVLFHDLKVVARIKAPKSGCEPGRPGIYWTREKNQWVDMTTPDITRRNRWSDMINPDMTKASHETSCDPTVELDMVIDHLPRAHIRVGKGPKPAIAGIWTSTGDFLTFSGLSIGQKPKIEGCIIALRALFDTSRTTEGAFSRKPVECTY